MDSTLRECSSRHTTPWMGAVSSNCRLHTTETLTASKILGTTSMMHTMLEDSTITYLHLTSMTFTLQQRPGYSTRYRHPALLVLPHTLDSMVYGALHQWPCFWSSIAHLAGQDATTQMTWKCSAISGQICSTIRL